MFDDIIAEKPENASIISANFILGIKLAEAQKVKMFFPLAFCMFLWLNSFTKKQPEGNKMKEYEIHTTLTCATDGGSEEGGYFVKYITAKNMTEAKQSLRTELKTAGYKSIKMEAIEA